MQVRVTRPRGPSIASESIARLLSGQGPGFRLQGDSGLSESPAAVELAHGGAHGQGGQGRTGVQTCAPHPPPPSKICAPRPAPPCAPAQTGEPGHPAAGP